MSEPIWIEEDVVLAIHDRQLAEHGGAAGVRDVSLLPSALARPQNQLAYLKSDAIELAAKYIAGIVQNHPFVDGNKRTGFVVGVLFLELNGYRFTSSEADAAQAILELASGRIHESGLLAFVRGNVSEVAPRSGSRKK